jgi:23S rRNA (pseudouridine1915-N3)-methyltransferase
MKIVNYCFGKEHELYVKDGIQIFTKRISHYYGIEWQLLPPPKNAATLSEAAYKQAEAKVLVDKLSNEDYIVCLDERGKMLNSPQLGNVIQQAANQSSKRLVFVIGGAYGIHADVLKKANLTWSLSALVFPHQLVRLLLAEQIYRACTINNNEKYHH